MRFIVWPAKGLSLMWATGSDFRTEAFLPEDRVGSGVSMREHSFQKWHSAIVDAMHWAYEPQRPPPAGWRDANQYEQRMAHEAKQAMEARDEA
jgi:hypothetical protein